MKMLVEVMSKLKEIDKTSGVGMKIDDKLSEIFEIEPMKDSTDIIDLPSNQSEASLENDKVKFDVDAVRTNLYAILAKGGDALEDAIEVAKNSEHPRAFEVVGGLMKTLSDINHQILDIHAKEKDLTKKDTPKEQVTNNTMFVGSTTELLQLLKDKRK